MIQSIDGWYTEYLAASGTYGFRQVKFLLGFPSSTGQKEMLAFKMPFGFHFSLTQAKSSLCS